MSIAKDLVDAIATDLDTNGSLGAHTTVKYRRPRAIVPDDCPLLVVWFMSKEPNLETGTTDRFDKTIGIGVSWHEETVAEAQTLVNDEAKSTALIDALEKIEARSHELSRLGAGVAEVYEILPGASAYVPPEMQDGLVEAVVHELVCRTSEV